MLGAVSDGVRICRITDTLSSYESLTRDSLDKSVSIRYGISWTGVRLYDLGNGPVRMLHRPEQFLSPGFLKRCASRTCTRSHPLDAQGNEVDITPANWKRYAVGQLGSEFETRETAAGYKFPSGVARLLDLATIDDIETKRRLGSSLGYYAGIFGPVDREIEREHGAKVGVWAGPAGPEAYDLEHVVDPKDQRFETYRPRDRDFTPDDLGPNHFAVALLLGRGLDQANAIEVVRDAASPTLFVFGSIRDRSTRPMAEQDPTPPARPFRQIRFTHDARKGPIAMAAIILDDALPPEVAEKVLGILEALKAGIAELEAMVGAGNGKIAELEDALAKAKAEVEAGKTATTDVAKARDTALGQVKVLEAEVAEHRVAELDREFEASTKLLTAKNPERAATGWARDKFEDLPALRSAVVTELHGADAKIVAKAKAKGDDGIELLYLAAFEGQPADDPDGDGEADEIGSGSGSGSGSARDSAPQPKPTRGPKLSNTTPPRVRDSGEDDGPAPGSLAHYTQPANT
jgi:hypothetical protein